MHFCMLLIVLHKSHPDTCVGALLFFALLFPLLLVLHACVIHSQCLVHPTCYALPPLFSSVDAPRAPSTSTILNVVIKNKLSQHANLHRHGSKGFENARNR